MIDRPAKWVDDRLDDRKELSDFNVIELIVMVGYSAVPSSGG